MSKKITLSYDQFKKLKKYCKKRKIEFLRKFKIKIYKIKKGRRGDEMSPIP